MSIARQYKTGGVGPDSTISYSLTPNPNKRPPILEYDMGIGWGQLDGFSVTSPAQMQGNVRELPSVSVYGTWHMENVEAGDFFTQFARPLHLSTYFGVRTGVLNLQDTQVYLTSSTAGNLLPVGATAETFEVGVIPLGFDLHWAGLDFTAEWAYTTRRFNSVSYSQPGGGAGAGASTAPQGIPATLPRNLDFSGHSLEFGVQLPIPASQGGGGGGGGKGGSSAGSGGA